MTQEANAPMSVGMGGGEMEPEPGEDVGAILSELATMGVQIQPGPNGTVILSGIPPEALAALGAASAPQPMA